MNDNTVLSKPENKKKLDISHFPEKMQNQVLQCVMNETQKQVITNSIQ